MKTLLMICLLIASIPCFAHDEGNTIRLLHLQEEVLQQEKEYEEAKAAQWFYRCAFGVPTVIGTVGLVVGMTGSAVYRGDNSKRWGWDYLAFTSGAILLPSLAFLGLHEAFSEEALEEERKELRTLKKEAAFHTEVGF